MEVFLIIIAILLLIAGIAGLIHPAIPGLPLMFGGVWLLAYVGDYQYIGSTTLIIVGIFVVIGMAMDFISGLLGAKFTGASKKALWGAFIGGVVGIFMGLFGIILGPIIGAAVGEYLDKQDLIKSGVVSAGTFAGILVGTIAKVGCAFAIIGITLSVHLFSLIKTML